MSVAVSRLVRIAVLKVIARRRTFTLHLAPLDDFSLLVNAVSTMTEEDARNFEIIKLFAPAAIPFIFI